MLGLPRGGRGTASSKTVGIEVQVIFQKGCTVTDSNSDTDKGTVGVPAPQDARSQGGEASGPYGSAIVQMRGEYPKAFRGWYDSAMTGRSPTAAIRAFCLSCVGYSGREVERCTCPACPLYLYRFGKMGPPPEASP